MKKTLAWILALMMALSLAACGGLSSKEKAGSAEKKQTAAEEKPSAAEEKPADDEGAFGLSEKELAEADEAWDKLQEMFYAEDWKWEKDDDWGYINGKWDEGVMYDPVPSPPEGMQIVEMQYHGKKSTRWSESGNIGEMYIDSSSYENISVDFDCSKAQLEELIQNFTDAGWLVTEEENHGNGDEWHFFYGKDYYAYLRAGDFMADDGYELGAYLDVLPAYYELPSTMAGIKLPQYGILMGTPWVTGYDEDYEMAEDIGMDTPADQLPPLWMFSSEEYYGVTVENIKEYRDQMAAEGWEVAYEQEEPQYAVTLRQGEIRIECGIPYGDAMYILIANSDDLYY